MTSEEILTLLKDGRTQPRNEWMSNVQSASDLSGRIFSRVDFSGAVFQDTDLAEAKFLDCTCLGCNFSDCNLRNASFRGSNLSGSDFIRANLEGADLSNTDLIGANLTGACITGIDLAGALLGHTSLLDVTLDNVKGLDSVNHITRSHIDTHTLSESHGPLPILFLRGCGVSEELIATLCGSLRSYEEYYSCFISYSHEDSIFARKLHDALQTNGVRCWLDKKEILPGDNIYHRIEEGVRLSDKVLLCASRHSLTSAWVDDELTHAFAKEKLLFRERSVPVQTLIPLDLDGYIFDQWRHPKKSIVLERLVSDFQGWDTVRNKFRQELLRVLRALELRRAEAESRDRMNC